MYVNKKNQDIRIIKSIPYSTGRPKNMALNSISQNYYNLRIFALRNRQNFILKGFYWYI